MSDILKQCKFYDVKKVTPDCLLKRRTKDVMSQICNSACTLADRQATQSRYQPESVSFLIIKLQSDVIDAQNRALQTSDKISKTAEDSVKSGIKTLRPLKTRLVPAALFHLKRSSLK